MENIWDAVTSVWPGHFVSISVRIRSTCAVSNARRPAPGLSHHAGAGVGSANGDIVTEPDTMLINGAKSTDAKDKKKQ